MKMRLLFLSLLVLCTVVSADEKENDVLRKMRVAGLIVVIDSDNKPVEVQIENEGDTIVCYSQKHKDSRFFTVHKWMFKRGQFSILIHCVEDGLSYKQGYI